MISHVLGGLGVLKRFGWRWLVWKVRRFDFGVRILGRAGWGVLRRLALRVKKWET